MTIRILPNEMQALIELAQQDKVSISVPICYAKPSLS
jgi:hypothetical protein